MHHAGILYSSLVLHKSVHEYLLFSMVKKIQQPFPAKTPEEASATAAYQSGQAVFQEGLMHPVSQGHLTAQGPQHAPALQCWEAVSRHRHLPNYQPAALQPDQNADQHHLHLLDCPGAPGTLLYGEGGSGLRVRPQGSEEVLAGMQGQGAVLLGAVSVLHGLLHGWICAARLLAGLPASIITATGQHHY